MLRKLQRRPGVVLIAIILILLLTIWILGGMPLPGALGWSSKSVELTKDTEITSKDVLGSLAVDYPQRLTPMSSDTVVVAISSPRLLASADPQTAIRIEVSEDAPTVLGKVKRFETIILIQERLRVVLTAPTLSIEPLYPDIQIVTLGQANPATIWAWSIIAPETPGLHTMNLRVYVPDKGETPVWVGVFQIEIVPGKTVARETALGRWSDRLSPGGIIVLCLILIVVVCLFVYGAIRLRKRQPWKQGPDGSGNEGLRRELLRLDDVELDELCLDHFRAVYDKFSRGTRHDEKINLLLDYCLRNDRANGNDAETKRLAVLLKKRL